VINQIELKEKIVLDIACGEGYGCNILSKYSKFVFGVDNSKETINYAKKKYSIPNSMFLVGNASSIPLDDKSVDVVTSFETIEHHNLHTEMMQEFKRVLKEDGILVISTPDKGYYENYFPGYNNEFHVKELYHDTFKSLINKYFKYSEFFLQNNIVGSIIANENENSNYNIPLLIEESSGRSEIIVPRFNISIASDSDLFIFRSITICTPSFYYDVFSVIQGMNNTIHEQEKKIQNIYKSNAWKISRLLTYPIRKFFKILI
jgi:ubiquinone/menaquinone biosynthesis C-methylase UbiE